MGRKVFVIMCLTLLITTAFVTPTLAARQVLSISRYQQQQTWWCWAACDKMIIQFCESSSPTQSDIVTFIHGSPINAGATTDDTRNALTNWNVTSSRQYNPLSYTAVVSQINNNHPILAVLQIGNTNTAHDNVVRGYDTSNDTVLFVDPADGDYHAQSYSSYCNGTHWDGVNYNWAHSIFSCS